MDKNLAHHRSIFLIALLFMLAMIVTGASRAATPAAAQQAPIPDSALLFIRNVGQFDPAARFQLRTAGASFWLTDEAIWLSVLTPGAPAGPGARLKPATGLDLPPVSGVNLRLSFVGAAAATPTGFRQQTAGIHYLLGQDESRRRTDVPVWGGVRYAALYPGIDLELVGDGGRLAPRLVCWAEDCAAALAGVALRIDGADELTIDGDLIRLGTAAGELALPLPVVVDGAGAVLEHDLAPVITNGDSKPAVIARPFGSGESPLELPHDGDGANGPAAAGEWLEVIYSSYLGGGRGDVIHAITGDSDGNAYLTGWSQSADFPVTPGAFFSAEGTTDLFVTKLAADGNRLIYSSLIGGSYQDVGLSIAVSGGTVTVGGTTNSTDFPTTSDAFDRKCNDNGCPGGPEEGDAVLVRLNAAGNDLLYATYLGGAGHDEIRAVAIQSTAVVMAGVTSSDNFPVTAAAYDKTYADADINRFNGDGFAARLVPGASSLAYGTYFGGTYYDDVRDMAISSDGTATIVGSTLATDFPTTPGAFDRQHAGSAFCGEYDPYGCQDAFVLRLNNTGSNLVYSTYLGGEDQPDSVAGVALNPAGEAFLVGTTSSDDFPVTAGAFDISHGSAGEYDCDYEACSDAFVARLAANGGRLVYSTFLGGGGDYLYDWGEDISVDADGIVTVVGFTQSPDFPTTATALARPCSGCTAGDGYLSRLNATGSGLLYSTLFGGGDFDSFGSLVAVGRNDWLVAGQSYSSDFPTTAGAYDTGRAGPGDGVVARFQVNTQAAAAGWSLIGQASASGGGISNTAGQSSAPAAAIGPDGSLYVAWAAETAADAEIYVRRWNGAAWVEVGSGSASGGGISNNTGDSLSPDIAATANGVIVVWSDLSTGDAEIYAREWNGSSWRELAGSGSGGGLSDNRGESVFPAVDAGPRGPVVAWADSTPGASEIYVKQWDGKAWKEMQKGSATSGGISRNGGDSVQPAVAHDASGVAFVAWTDNTAGDTEIYVKRFLNGKWVVAGANSATGGGISNNSGLSRGVALAASGGGPLAAWADESGGNLEIYVRQWDGKAWREVGGGSASGRGISLSGGTSQGAAAAIGEDGRPFVTWYDNSAANTEIYIRRWTGTRWAEVRSGSARGGGISDDIGASSQPDLVVSGGIPVVVWGDATSGKYQIYGRRSDIPAVVCYGLQVTKTGQGATPTVSPAQSPACSAGKYVPGETITLTAAPAQGHRVDGWLGTTDDSSTAATNLVTMPAANHTAGVIYGPIPPACYALTLANDGEGSPPTAAPAQSGGCESGRYLAGAKITLTARPAPGWQVARWSGTDNDSATSTQNTLTMPGSDRVVTVSYEKQGLACYGLQLDYTGLGQLPLATPTGSEGCAPGRYVSGTVVNLLARPATGWQLGSWSGTDNDSSMAGLNQVTMGEAERSVLARYRPAGNRRLMLLPMVADNAD